VSVSAVARPPGVVGAAVLSPAVRPTGLLPLRPANEQVTEPASGSSAPRR
jgi:hypothetical protein